MIFGWFWIASLQPQLYGFLQIGANLFLRFPLCNTTGKRWNLSPVAAFFRLVHHSLNDHVTTILPERRRAILSLPNWQSAWAGYNMRNCSTSDNSTTSNAATSSRRRNRAHANDRHHEDQSGLAKQLRIDWQVLREKVSIRQAQ